MLADFNRELATTLNGLEVLREIDATSIPDLDIQNNTIDKAQMILLLTDLAEH